MFNLAAEIGRHVNIPTEERSCNFCDDNVLEDEFHAITICIKYKEIRCFYIAERFFIYPAF